ncbi:carboxypeptidase-like regulatory domain-containing protein [Simiduia aestuariiviva]|uniref:DUF6795 domain-containing protein n=1 Tax=Simiduia aestuariiviva TaxID=1510459 RepID=A0A839ULR2_9GAMM|nr:carboxypeptidase-like regulatory domain-containing protein [Simiduia aestuariiviva]MBB3167499.1 hypothetical protein [Simiduia aestuariiviva]
MNKANLFSATEGVITLAGAPLQNAEVIRTVRWRDENHQDSTATDADGNFSFPDLMSDRSLSVLPSEFNAFQKIIVKHNNETFLLWETVKADPVSNGELEGEALRFTCELNEEPRFVHLLLNSIETRCHW